MPAPTITTSKCSLGDEAGPSLPTSVGLSGTAAPYVGDRKALREGVVWVEHIAGVTGNPRTSRDRRHDSGTAHHVRLGHQPPRKNGPEHSFVAKVHAQWQLPAGMEDRHAGAGGGAAR